VKTRRLRSRSLKVLRAESCAESSEVSILLTGDESITILNGEYRGIEEPTDVLSFSQHEGEDEFAASQQENPLGDVVISVETAKRQAEEQATDLDSEIDMLLVHGLLHLLGYDHAEPDEAEKMFARQAELLK
jgi:probable rRNA maturation factor